MSRSLGVVDRRNSGEDVIQQEIAVAGLYGGQVRVESEMDEDSILLGHWPPQALPS
jgi:hypothetical protein